MSPGIALTCRVLVVAILLGSIGPVSPAAEIQPSESPPSLDVLLPRLGRLAELFRDTALRFTCEEAITWSGALGSGRQKFGYVYVHDEEKGFVDYRTWIGPGRGSKPREVIPSKEGVPAYVLSASLWVFVFQETRRHFHRYEIVGERTVLDRPAVGIRFEPIPPHRERVNDWFGAAWVDRETFQLLEVQAWRPEDHAMKRALESHMSGGPRARPTYDIEQVTTEYTVSENGMRFPGKVELRRTRYTPYRRRGTWRREERRILEVRQVYRNYEFFGVRTAEGIFSFISTGEPGSR